MAHNKTKFTNLIHQWGLDGDNVSDDDVDDDVDDDDENDNDGEILGERRSGRVAQQGIPAAADRVGEQVQQVLSDYHHCNDQKIMIKYWHRSFMARENIWTAICTFYFSGRGRLPKKEVKGHPPPQKKKITFCCPPSFDILRVNSDNEIIPSSGKHRGTRCLYNKQEVSSKGGLKYLFILCN